MKIMPNSTLKFLRNIPFDNDYNDTIYFPNPASQYNYFSGNEFVKYELTDQYYTRHSAGVINVELPLGSGYDPITHEEYKISTAESLFDCNYIMFCNESFRYIDQEDGFRKKKWFYAFITEIEYVNNEVARVTFEIDAMQSWMFDYELEQCFIEREHSATDGIGDNIVDENLEMGDSYLTTNVVNKIATTERMYAYILVSREEQNGSIVYQPIILRNNVPTSLAVHRFNCSTELTAMNNFIEKYIIDTTTDLTPDEIVSIYLFPDETFWGVGENEITITLPSDFRYTLDNYHTSHHQYSYTPVNKKMFTSPYTVIDVSNHEGTSQLYKFEYFTLTAPTRQAKFKIFGCDAPSPALVVYPLNYMPASSPTSSDSKEGYDYGVTISDFQQCAWVGDAFKAWWAQNKNTFTATSNMNAIGGGVTSGVGAVTSNPYLYGRGITDMVSAVWESVGKKFDISHKSPSISGLSNSISLPIAMDYFGYTFRTKQISGQYAEIIDEYFSMFGYATHRVKTPNRNVRERCTYTQTKGCTIKGKLPSKYQKQICQIYDKGIRFWNKDVQLGEYKNSQGELYPNRCLAELPNQ